MTQPPTPLIVHTERLVKISSNSINFGAIQSDRYGESGHHGYRSVDTGQHRIQRCGYCPPDTEVWIQDSIEYRGVDTAHQIQKCGYRTT